MTTEWTSPLLRGAVTQRAESVLRRWIAAQDDANGSADSSSWVHEAGAGVLEELGSGLATDTTSDLRAAPYEGLRHTLDLMSTERAIAGASPSDVATGVLLLREALVDELVQGGQANEADVATAVVEAGRLVDAMALLTFDSYVRGRDQIIKRQHGQLSELSTPVLRLWDGIVGAPLVGTLDSNRASTVMEALLNAIVREGASVAILDITGVPTVDTLVAQHLFKTVTATRLMGADCIISGISPQTALTIVQLGIDLTEVTTRATLADALVTAIAWVAPKTVAVAT